MTVSSQPDPDRSLVAIVTAAKAGEDVEALHIAAEIGAAEAVLGLAGIIVGFDEWFRDIYGQDLLCCLGLAAAKGTK